MSTSNTINVNGETAMTSELHTSDQDAKSNSAQLRAQDAQIRHTIHDKPVAGQLVHHAGKDYTTIKEGLAYILVPPNAKMLNDPKRKRQPGDKNLEHLENQSVFYNEIMQYNRDLSVLAIRAFGEDVLERARVKEERKQKFAREHEARRRLRRGGAGAQGPTVAKAEGSDGGANGEVQEPAIATTSTAGGVKRALVEETDSREATHESKRIKVNHSISDRTEAVADPPTSAPEDNSMADVGGIDEGDLPDEALINLGTALDRSNGPSTKQHARPHKLNFKILDALSATGLRALRYARELPFVTSVVANDLSPAATQMIAANVEHNGLKAKITSVTGNAVSHMYQFVGLEGKAAQAKRYNVIDLDPYGTAVPFLDSAFQALSDGGLLCVTCTDTAVFMSAGYPEKSFSLYGGTPVKGQCSHEGGLRLILHAIASAAAKYGCSIEPLLSLSIDYYARVFVRARRRPADVKFLMGKTMTVSNCDNGCHAIKPQWLGRNTSAEGKGGTPFWKHGYAAATEGTRCEHCGFKLHVNGPMWGGPLHNPSFIDRILSFLPELDQTTYPTTDRMEGMLTTALEELRTFQWSETASSPDEIMKGKTAGTQPKFIDPTPPEIRDLHPFYIFPSSLAKTFHCMAPSENQLRGALRHAGFKAARTHAARGGIKTDAPWSAVWRIMREWVRQKAPIKEGAVTEGMAGWKILYGHGASDEAREPVDKGASEDMDVSREGDEGGKDTVSQVAVHQGMPDGANQSFEVVFDEDLGKDSGKKLKRFQLNPRANWGPMAKAK